MEEIQDIVEMKTNVFIEKMWLNVILFIEMKEPS